MSTPATAPRPLFPVPQGAPSRSIDENVKLLATVCHVCEVKPGAGTSGWTYALVHASPTGVAKIATELGLEVFHSKKGDEYYAVVLAKSAVAPRPSVRPVPPPVVDDTPVPAPEVLPVRRPAPAPVASSPTPAALEPGVVRLEIRGTNYIVRQTTPKRRMDVLRYEVRKDAGDVITEPYVVSFQDEAGRQAQCSCPDWIYRRRQCKHIEGVRNALVKPRQATIPLTAVG